MRACLRVLPAVVVWIRPQEVQGSVVLLDLRGKMFISCLPGLWLVSQETHRDEAKTISAPTPFRAC